MIIGQFTFIDVINRETMKLSTQPLIYIMSRGVGKFLIPSSVERDKLGRRVFHDPTDLEVEGLGIREAIELHFASSGTGAIKESEFYVNRILRPLQLGKGQSIQGVELSTLTPKTSIFFDSTSGQVKLVNVKGHSSRSIIHAEMYRVNVKHTVNNLFVSNRGHSEP